SYVYRLRDRTYSFYSLCRRFLFFFELCAAHQDLHSFPTRRSSDLSTRSSRAMEYCGACFRYDQARARVVVSMLRAGGAVRLCLEDRKSTRLNSSHQIISYAVFCLKKKITTQT